MVEIESKRSKGLCVAFRCSNTNVGSDKFCSKHRKRQQKKNNLVAYTFNLLKSNAKRRGKFFDLTLDQFKTFCKETGYLVLKGKKCESASIDRIDHSLGYSIDNLQVLSLRDNGTKGQQEGQAPF